MARQIVTAPVPSTWVPRQRGTLDPEVVVLVRALEPLPRHALRRGGSAALTEDIPLDVVVLEEPDAGRADRLAAADRALQQARTDFPQLELRVHDTVADVATWLGDRRVDVRRLCASRETAALVHSDGAVIRTSAVEAVLFDLDGVLTDTAWLHRAAWGRLVEEHLGGRALTDLEYVELVDGRRREDGLLALLAARGATASPDALTRLAAAKDRYFLDLLAERGACLLPGSVLVLERLRRAGVRCAVVTASRNCTRILEAGGLSAFFDARVDGQVVAELGLPGKPDPASFLEAARRLGVAPARAVVVEDAQAGVAAGRRGGFGLVIGVDRRSGLGRLREHGADVTVTDLRDVIVLEDA